MTITFSCNLEPALANSKPTKYNLNTVETMIIQNCNKERLKDNADYTDDPSEVKAETLARVRMRIQEYLQLRDNNHKHN